MSLCTHHPGLAQNGSSPQSSGPPSPATDSRGLLVCCHLGCGRASGAPVLCTQPDALETHGGHCVGQSPWMTCSSSRHHLHDIGLSRCFWHEQSFCDTHTQVFHEHTFTFFLDEYLRVGVLGFLLAFNYFLFDEFEAEFCGME